MKKLLGFSFLGILLASPLAVVTFKDYIVNHQSFQEQCEIVSLQYEVRKARELLQQATDSSQRVSSPQELEALRENVQGLENQISSLNQSIQKNYSDLTRMSEETVSKLREQEGRLSDAVLAKIQQAEGKWAEELDRLEGKTQELDTDQSAEKYSTVKRDIQTMLKSMVYPTLQISGIDTVGSAILIYSGEDTTGKTGYNNYALTSYHVIRNILEEFEGKKNPHITSYLYDQASPKEEDVDMIIHDEKLDLALLKLHTRRKLEHVARICPKAKWPSVEVFTQVYAVGCPLGNDPIPTLGEIASTKNIVNGVNYWMINAPTYFGNSGGGIFLAKSQELIGVFSKIYTHGQTRPVVISHMGLATPIDVVCEWLSNNGYDFLLTDVYATEPVVNASSK